MATTAAGVSLWRCRLAESLGNQKTFGTPEGPHATPSFYDSVADLIGSAYGELGPDQGPKLPEVHAWPSTSHGFNMLHPGNPPPVHNVAPVDRLHGNSFLNPAAAGAHMAAATSTAHMAVAAENERLRSAQAAVIEEQREVIREVKETLREKERIMEKEKMIIAMEKMRSDQEAALEKLRMNYQAAMANMIKSIQMRSMEQLQQARLLQCQQQVQHAIQQQANLAAVAKEALQAGKQGVKVLEKKIEEAEKKEKHADKVMKARLEVAEAEAAREERRRARAMEELRREEMGEKEFERRRAVAEIKFEKGPAPWARPDGWVDVGVEYVIDFSLSTSGPALHGFELKMTRRARFSADGLSIRERPFARGSFRLVHYVRYDDRQWVGKLPIFVPDDAAEKQAMAETAKQYLVAKELIKGFSRALQEKGLLHGRQLRCMDTFVLKLDDGRRLMMEEYRAGSRFMKFNNNETFVLEEEGGMVDPLPQALSHYSFHITDRRYLYVDVQGFRDGAAKSGGTKYLFTDPAFHSRGKAESLGSPDNGEEGMRQFFTTHTCNDLCHALGLTASVL